MRTWLRSSRSALLSGTAGLLLVALIATLAVTSGGYSAQRFDLGDGSVWVANGSRQAIGRVNTQIRELNTVVPSVGTALDVVQAGASVLLMDRGNSTMNLVDPATSKVTATVPLPSDQPNVYLTAGAPDGSQTAVLHSRTTGGVWVLPAAALGSFDSGSAPTLSLGANSVSTMDSSGRLFVFNPSTGMLSRIEATSGGVVNETRSVPAGGRNDSYALSEVAGRFVLLNATTRMLYLDSGTVDLSALLPADSSATLAAPGNAAADGAVGEVLIAWTGGLLAVPLNAGPPTVLAPAPRGAAGSALPAAPVVLGGCAYAAWTDGTLWQRCAGAATTATVTGMAPRAQLAFRSNGTVLVLNDSRSGATWAVQDKNAPINNWSALLDSARTDRVVEENSLDVPPVYDKNQQPPVANADEFGARPGRSTPLPVLLNDYDPNGDVLVITDVTSLPPGTGTVRAVGNRQQLLLTLPATVSGALTFSYTITDGRGGSATANVTVTVRSATENSPPRQVRPTKATVQAGGRLTSQVLGDWMDPDGDPFYLTAATVPAPDTVSYKPNGEIAYTDSGAGGELKQVALTVSDGRADGGGSVAVTVRPSGAVPVIAEPFAVLAYAGQPVVLTPLSHVRGGTGTVRLINFPDKSGVTLVADYASGTVQFTSAVVGSHYLEYTVGDGTTTTTGVIRVDVLAPPDSNARPVTVPHTAFVRAQSSYTLDVLATDFDPAGGVLLITAVSPPPADSGVRIELVEQRLLRITLSRPLTDSVSFGYRVSNGYAEADGAVTVVQIPDPPRKQPPIARPDRVTVRAGDAINIPVLSNDEHPDGDPLTLNPTLVTPLPDGAGLLFAAGDQLRYLAPAKTGDFTAVYRVEGPDGQWATAEVTISVREPEISSNSPPAPRTVTARVLAGEKVRIPIPLNGIDPNGDSVQLLGQETNPDKGSVTASGKDWIEYRAGQYSAGTDTFRYSVIDALGARASGIVRVGIGPRPDGVRNPVAVADSVTVRPGRTVSVQVLANDSDPDGGALTVTGIQPTSPGATAKVVGNIVQVTVPQQPGRYGFIYDIQNERNGTSSNFLTVTVDPNAPLTRPQVQDSVLALSDILGRPTVDVNVLAGVFYADGDVASLEVAVLPGYSTTAQVVENKQVRVAVTDQGQIVPFRVRSPEDPRLASYGFIWVPGLRDALPQLRKGAPPLTVPSEQPLTISLSDYVVAVGNAPVRLTDSATVRASHADGSNLVLNGSQLRFTSAARYFGPASISFEVTDGATATDPNGRKATLVLPITVTPRDKQPPTFTGGMLEFEPGQERVIDLTRLTDYPYPRDLASLVYTVSGSEPAGFSVRLAGAQLTVQAKPGTAKGAAGTVTVSVRDAGSAVGQTGRLELRVVPSTRPLATPADDRVTAARNATTTVNVLANDEAGNPFPGTPLTVAAVRNVAVGSLPAGISVLPSADRSSLAVTVAADVKPQDLTVQYQVLDATGDPGRSAWGTVTISIQDRPDPVSALTVTAFADRAVSVSFTPGAANNSPILEYRLTTYSLDGQPIATIGCPSTNCTVPTPGNGPAYQVRIGVVATNALGASASVQLGDPVWSDVVPAAPVAVDARPLDHGLRLFWQKPADAPGASPITYYSVTVGGLTRTTTVPVADSPGTAYTLDLTDPSLGNGGATKYSISSRNGAYPAFSNWNSTGGVAVPAGPPTVDGAPSATASTDGSNTVQLNWSGVFGANGRPVTDYYAAQYRGTPPVCAADGVGSQNPNVRVPPPSPSFQHLGGGLSATFTGVASNQENRFVVFAYNQQGCTSSGELTAITRTPPGTVSDVAVTGPENSGSNTFDFRFTGATFVSGGDGTVSYRYRLTGDFPTQEGEVRPGGLLLGDGRHYGRVVNLSLLVCQTYGSLTLCAKDYSAPKALGVPVSLRVDGLRAAASNQTALSRDVTFSWTAAPAGSAVVTQYSPDGGADWSEMPGQGSVTVTGVGVGQQAELLVRATVRDGPTYGPAVYRERDYG